MTSYVENETQKQFSFDVQAVLESVMEAVMEAAEGKLTIIAHVACNNTADSQALAAHAQVPLRDVGQSSFDG